MIFTLVSGLAHAHGEEVLESVYAELASITVCAILLFSWHRAVDHRAIGLVACVASLVVGNWAVSDLPYMQYRYLITAVGFVIPIVATVSAIYVSHRLASRKRQL
jgi:hypothetical protein